MTFFGIVLALMGDFGRALDLFKEGLDLATAIGDRWFAALCLTEQIGTELTVGRAKSAYERLQSAVADWRAIGDPRFTARRNMPSTGLPFRAAVSICHAALPSGESATHGGRSRP